MAKRSISDDVAAYFATLKHPHAAALRSLRDIIVSADAGISEGIKWHVPSFRTTEYFATLHVRAKKGVGVILHFGPKKRAGLTARADISDPAKLLSWLADDRAMVSFQNDADVVAKKAAVSRVIRQWIEHV